MSRNDRIDSATAVGITGDRWELRGQYIGELRGQYIELSVNSYTVCPQNFRMQMHKGQK